MSTGFDNRAILIKLIEGLDTPEIEIMQAFAAGYEAGKTEKTPNCPAKRLDQGKLERRPKPYIKFLQLSMKKGRQS